MFCLNNYNVHYTLTVFRSPERDLGYGQKSSFTAALARHRLGPRPVIVFP